MEMHLLRYNFGTSVNLIGVLGIKIGSRCFLLVINLFWRIKTLIIDQFWSNCCPPRKCIEASPYLI